MDVSNSYEAAWYLMNGATITDVRTRHVSSKKKSKLGFSVSWVLHMEHVNPEWVVQWRQGQAVGNLKDFANQRLRLKHRVKDLLTPNGSR